jgi:hypothetical protein
MARPSTTILTLAAVLALAFALRLAWIAQTDTELLPLSDPQYYHATASNLADGHGYQVTLDPQRGFIADGRSEGTAFWAPGYPFALAPLYALTDNDERSAKLFNAIVGALTVIPVFYLALKLAASALRNENNELTNVPVYRRPETAGLAGAAIFALAPTLAYWTPSLFSEPLFTFAIAATLATAAWAGERGTLAAYFLAGLALAATAFVRSQGLLMILPVAILLVRSLDARHAARALLPVGAAIALAVIPWAIRNEVVMGRPYLINNNLGYNLRLAHAPYSEGTSIPPQDLWDEQPGITFKERELLFDELGRERALEYMRENPGREMQLAVKRVSYLLRSDAEAAVQWSQSLGLSTLRWGSPDVWIMIGDLYWYLLLVATLASPLVLAKTRVAFALWSALVVWGLLHTMFAGEPRYHVPLMSVMAVLTGAALVRLWAMFFEPQPDSPSAENRTQRV